MTKGELRKLRKEQHEQGRPWSTEHTGEGNIKVRERTRKEEIKHQAAMSRWASLHADRD